MSTSTAPHPVAPGPATSVARRHRRAVLAVDGAGCAAIGFVLVAAPSWPAEQLGLATSTPVRLVGVAFVAAALINLIAARSGQRAPAVAAIELDVACGLGALVVAVADPWGASALGRGLLVATALVCAGFGATKARGLPGRSGSARAGRR